MQPAVERSTGERYEHVLRFSKNISGSRSSQEVMGAVASELPSVLTYDYVSLFLNDERRYGTGCYELTQEGQSILAKPGLRTSASGSDSWWRDPHQARRQIPQPTWNAVRLRHPSDGELAIPMATLQLPR